MKKLIMLFLVVALACIPVLAQEEAASQGGVQYGQLAQLLVKALGLARFLPAVPTDAECFQILAQNGIAPASGWNNDGIVTKGDTARVLVQALGLSDEVENPEDPNSWIATLEANNITLDRISTSVAQAELLPDGITQSYDGTTDPLLTHEEPGSPADSFLPGDLSPVSIDAGNVSSPTPKPTPTPTPTPTPIPTPTPKPRPTPTPH
jgi:hypothetical protein